MTQEEIELFIKEQEDNYLRAKIYWLPEIERLADEGDWAEFIHRATTVYQVMPEAFEYYYDIPEEMRRDFALSCYIHHGDSVEGCRNAVKGLDKNGINELPSEYAKAEYITVFRAGAESLQDARSSLSWTLSKEVAEFFFNRSNWKRAIYKAKIRPCDVIAYIDYRDEKEVLQHNSIFDIETIKERRRE